MKPEHAHSHAPKHGGKPQALSGIYRQPIYSPKGGLEGLLLDIDGAPVQIVLDAHADTAAFADVTVGQRLTLDAAPSKPSPKGEAVHAVFEFHALRSVDGHARQAATKLPRRFEGKVVRLNYARHGEPNGVVLDSGDFVHLRPHGFRAAGLKLGDAVAAEGAAVPMAAGGRVIEATRVNGVAIEPKKPKPHGGPKHGPKHGHHPAGHGPHHAH